ncbi:hypothetical protein [Paraburkholderia sp. ZP32-5]|uniref:hypothetical protein n=1 Tax=Paraburkholderia sp. ZP32-5 TaxID=2883245 RepID=UPI001F22DCED|nr:hypothetical protein [Paraburkholderia sp. ZP32-5]
MIVEISSPCSYGDHSVSMLWMRDSEEEVSATDGHIGPLEGHAPDDQRVARFHRDDWSNDWREVAFCWVLVWFLRSAQFEQNSLLGDKLKRLAAGIAGFGYGLGITWLCLIVLSHFGWFRAPHKITHGCNELGKCPFPLYNWLILYACIFGPATLALAINVYAWQRWSLKRWARYTGVAMIGCIALYFIATVLLSR